MPARAVPTPAKHLHTIRLGLATRPRATPHPPRSRLNTMARKAKAITSRSRRLLPESRPIASLRMANLMGATSMEETADTRTRRRAIPGHHPLPTASLIRVIREATARATPAATTKDPREPREGTTKASLGATASPHRVATVSRTPRGRAASISMADTTKGHTLAALTDWSSVGASRWDNVAVLGSAPLVQRACHEFRINRLQQRSTFCQTWLNKR